MTDNAVLQLRAERLARATRPFLARGNRIRRCQRCLLPLKVCLCETLEPQAAQSRFCLVMFDTEPMKPSNTGRLIADILPDTAAFQWSRTEHRLRLCSTWWQARTISRWWFSRRLMRVPSARCLPRRHPANRRCLLCWTAPGPKRGKCFAKAPIWIALPVISVDLSRVSAYRLREAHADGQYCTAEVAIALLDLAGDVPAAQALQQHFSRFRERYLAGKPHHPIHAQAFGGRSLTSTRQPGQKSV